MNINTETAKDIPCKNVLIYGYCKYENKGCAFSHPNSSNSAGKGSRQSTDTDGAKASSAATEPKRRFNTNTPLFQPLVLSLTNKFASLSSKLTPFVPESHGTTNTTSSTKTSGATFADSYSDATTATTTTNSTTSGAHLGANSGSHAQAANLANSAPSTHPAASATNTGKEPFAPRRFNAATPSFTPAAPLDSHFAADFDAYTPDALPTPPAPQKQLNPYLQPATPAQDYFRAPGAPAYPLNYHLYAPPPPPRFHLQLAAHEATADTMFVPTDVRELVTRKNAATLATLAAPALPAHVGVYHLLVLLDSTFDKTSRVWHVPCHVYKAFSNADGAAYTVRRLDASSKVRIANEAPFSTVKRWRTLRHANIVRLHDAFTSVAFGGDPALCLVYDYYPLATTLHEHHVARRVGSKLAPVSEDLLWAYAVQLTGALLAVHTAGLSAGSAVSLSKILVTNKGRVRLGSVAVDDILEYEALTAHRTDVGTATALAELQHGDAVRLGRVLLELAALSLATSARGGDTDATLAALSRAPAPFSPEFIAMVIELVHADDAFRLEEFYKDHLAERALAVLEAAQNSTDYYEAQMLGEVENARLFRLMAKINYVVDARSVDSELSGSIHVARLFRDYVFQTVNEFERPVADLSRVLTSLNKLDVGVDEKVLLVSRDDDTCIIVSFKEVKDIIDLTFRAIYR